MNNALIVGSIYFGLFFISDYRRKLMLLQP
jgi:hypothetical protein